MAQYNQQIAFGRYSIDLVKAHFTQVGVDYDALKIQASQTQFVNSLAANRARVNSLILQSNLNLDRMPNLLQAYRAADDENKGPAEQNLRNAVETLRVIKPPSKRCLEKCVSIGIPCARWNILPELMTPRSFKQNKI